MAKRDAEDGWLGSWTRRVSTMLRDFAAGLHPPLAVAMVSPAAEAICAMPDRLDDRTQWSAITRTLDTSIAAAHLAALKQREAAEQLEVTAYALARVKAEVAAVLLPSPDVAIPAVARRGTPFRPKIPFERRQRIAA